MRAWKLFLIVALVMVPATLLANYPTCSCCAPCVTYQDVQKTIMVPNVTWDHRTVTRTRYRPEMRECKVTVPVSVPETHQVTRPHTIMVAATTWKTQPYVVAKPIWETVVQSCTVQVPYPVVKQGVRTVCKTVPVQATRTVCEDQGHWGVDECGCKVWCSNLVTREIPCTVFKPVLVQQTYEYTSTAYKPEVRTRDVKVCRYEYETKTRQVPCVTYHPRQVTKTYNLVTYKCVPVEKTRRYTVMVPEPYQTTVKVPICTMVPKTITCKVPVYTCTCP